MRVLWVDAGQEPEWHRIQAFSALYFAATDPPLALRRRITEALHNNFGAGVYVAWNWGYAEGAPLAEDMHEVLKGLPPRTKVQFDIEEHSDEYVLDCLRRWRQLRPYTNTSWTLESFQGGWMAPAFVEEVVRLRVRVVPQFYLGGMEPVAQDMALRDLTRRGYPESLITGMYDAAHLPSGWDGFAFTQARLP